MTNISFCTAIHYGSFAVTSTQKNQENIDDYFYLTGKKACVISTDLMQKCDTTRLVPLKLSFFLTLLKIVSYLTVICPLIMLLAKAINRTLLKHKVILFDRPTESILAKPLKPQSNIISVASTVSTISIVSPTHPLTSPQALTPSTSWFADIGNAAMSTAKSGYGTLSGFATKNAKALKAIGKSVLDSSVVGIKVGPVAESISCAGASMSALSKGKVKIAAALAAQSISLATLAVTDKLLSKEVKELNLVQKTSNNP